MSFAVSFVPDNTYNVVSEINAQPFEVAPPWRPNPDIIVASGYPNPSLAFEKGGSMLFPGTSGSYLSVPNDIDFRFRTGQFTIEWFQYMTSQTANPRVFTIGSWNTATIGVSIENNSGGRLYFWVNGNVELTYVITSYLNTWVHMAITRDASNIIRIFQNGVVRVTSSANTADFNNLSAVLAIGNETNPGSQFPGYITNFHWVKGTALYTAAFTRPSQPITPVANTKLLLLATTLGTLLTDSSGLGKTVTNIGGIAWNSLNPF
jgi:hypothetical protein